MLRVPGSRGILLEAKAAGAERPAAACSLLPPWTQRPIANSPGAARRRRGGNVGAHGIAVLSVREGLEFESPVESDCAPLWKPVQALIEAGVEIHCLRDLTRGGLAQR